MNWTDYLAYEHGFLYWKIKPSKKVSAGSLVGHKEKDGYLRLRLLGKAYQAHRVIWEMHNGAIPPGMFIDHINHIRDDNRIENLRLVSAKENSRNRKLGKNSSGFMGVTWCKASEKWLAQIKVDGTNINLGYYTDKDEASSARILANYKFKFHKNHGA